MRKRILLLSLLFVTVLISAADFKSDFNKYFDAKDYDNQLKILQTWEISSPNDAELYTCYFNYYFSKSRQDVLTLTTDKPEGESIEFQDSTGKTAGFIGSTIVKDDDYFIKAIEKIDKGIQLYPNRLDMRFGKIYALGKSEKWANFTNEIIRAVKYSNVNKNSWTWTNNEPQKDGKTFFLGSLQDYQVQLYNTNNDTLINYMGEIAKEILKLYPDHIESLSNLSVTYMISNQYDKAIDVLLQATKIQPRDGVVLMNLAHAYKQKGDKVNSIIIYEKAIKYVDKESKEYAKNQISELKK